MFDTEWTSRGIPPEALLFVAAATLGFALLQTARLLGGRFAVRRRLRLGRERGAAGEVRAEVLLRALGYTILGRQVAVSYGLGLDGVPTPVALRADFLVAHRGLRYVAEVKTGRHAPRIETPATRRQLLEYRVAFDVDGVLLVDADADRVHHVVFPLPGPAPLLRDRRFAWLCAGIALGLAAAAAAR